MNYVRLFLRDIRIEHSLFALPFAYVGAVVAARGIPSLHALVWITLAVIGARTAAMAVNRYLDRKIDRENPRTKGRPTASGQLPASVSVCATVAGLLLLIVSAAMLSPLCLELLPLAALGILIYPLGKRFTWSVHFILGAVDALAPLGAYIAVAGRITIPALLLFVAVTVWVAGFDILYALMDYDIDIASGLRSFPAAFGQRNARRAPVVLHLIMAAALEGAGIIAHAGALYSIGVVIAIALVIYEERLIALVKNVFVLNDRVFVTNMAFSVIFLATTIAGFVR